MFKKLIVRGLLPALGVSGLLTAAAFAPSAGAHGFLASAYPTCSTVTIAGLPVSPITSGTHVIFTANAATCVNPRYEFWMRAASQSSWQLIQAYGTSNTYNWNSTGAVAGNQLFSVWARDSSSTAAYDAFAPGITYVTMTPSCASVTDAASPTSVFYGARTHSTITATPGACSSTPRYEFWMLPAGGSTWLMVQSYGVSATYDWNSTGAAAGAVRFSAWIRDANSSATYDAFTSTPATVTVNASVCASVTDAAVPTSVAPGVHSVITATPGACSSTPRYEFWMLPAGGSTWILVQSWGTAASYNWNSTGAAAGTVRFSAWVRDANSIKAYDAFTASPASVTVT